MLEIVIAVIVSLVIAIPVTIVASNAYHKNVVAKKIGGAEEQARAIIDKAVE